MPLLHTWLPHCKTVLIRRMQDIVVEYVTAMAHTGMDQASGRQGGKLQPEDILFLVRKARAPPLHALHACMQATCIICALHVVDPLGAETA